MNNDESNYDELFTVLDDLEAENIIKFTYESELDKSKLAKIKKYSDVMYKINDESRYFVFNGSLDFDAHVASFSKIRPTMNTNWALRRNLICTSTLRICNCTAKHIEEAIRSEYHTLNEFVKEYNKQLLLNKIKAI